MSSMREFIGCKSIETADYDGNGNNLYNMYLTDEEIVRCRDCKNAIPTKSPKMVNCLYFATWDYYNDEPGECLVDADGFCKWGDKR